MKARTLRQEMESVPDIHDQPNRSMRMRSRILPAFVLLLFVIQLFFPGKGWTILLTGFAGAWLISYLWARALKNGLRLEREMRFGWVQVGDPLQEQITVVNDGWAPGLWVRVIDESDMRDYRISTVTEVQGGKFRHWYARSTCRQRGLYTLGPTRLEAGDPFGIYQVSVDYAESAVMMVAPQVVALPEIDIAAGGRLGEGTSPVRGVEQTVTAGGIREYIPGDSLRFIHWPTTARRAEPFVYIFDNEPSSDWWVLLDMDPGVQIGEGARSTEEYGVTLAASLVNHGLQSSKGVGLICQGDELAWHRPDTGDPHLWKILRSLAKVRPGGAPLAEVLIGIRGSLEKHVSLVIITPSLSLDWLQSIEHLRRSGVVPTVILIDPVSFGGSGDLQAVRDRLVSMGIAHYTVSAELLGPAELPPDDLRFVPLARSRSAEPSGRGLRQKIARTLRSVGLIGLIYYGFVTALSAVLRGVEESLLWLAAAGGIGVGLLLAISPLPSWALVPLYAAAGLGLVMVAVGRLEHQISEVLRGLADLLRQQWARIFQEGDIPEAEPVLSGISELLNDLGSMGSRLGQWAAAALQGEPFFDPVAAAILWGFLTWGTAVWAMWALIRRRRPVLAVVPAVTVVAVSLANLGTFTYDLVLMLGATLTLTVFIRHDVRESIWKGEKLFFDATIRPKIVFAAVGLALGLMVVATVSPSISLESIRDLIEEVRKGPVGQRRLAPSIGLRPPQEVAEIDILDASRAGGLPNKHLLGSGPELSEEVVMLVQPISLAPGTGADSALETPMYMRNLVYDQYTGLGWESRKTQILEHSVGEQVISLGTVPGTLFRQEVVLTRDAGGLLVTAGTPVGADADLRVAWRVKDPSKNAYDVLGATTETNAYTADSILPAYGEDELRAASQTYPMWIRDRYLSLPTTVPERVLTLARDLTATAPNAYDRAISIEQYLRQYPYMLDISPPPVDVDVVEHFLFTSREGYCDYYATSMVVLSRAAGIPARLVTGFIAENYDRETGSYIVTADQAHSWPELYFPEFGWVPFEPTAGRAAIERPQYRAPELPQELYAQLAARIEEPSEPAPDWTKFVGPTVLIGIALLAVALIARDRLLSRSDPDRLVQALFRRIYRYGERIGIEIRPGGTPYEFAADLTRQMRILSQDSFFDSWLMRGVDQLNSLTENLMDLMFRSEKATEVNSKDIARLYLALRPRLWLIWLLSRMYRYPRTWSFFWKHPPIYAAIAVGKDE